MQNTPDRNVIFPVPNIDYVTYVKPTIKNPNIIAGVSYYSLYKTKRLMS